MTDETARRAFPLDAADFWRLRAMYAEARLTVLQTKAQLATVVQVLAEQHGFDPTSTLELDDATLTVTARPRTRP